MTTTTTNTSGFALPTIPAAHWLIRLSVAATFIYHGLDKFPTLAATAEQFGFPFIIWFLVAAGEVAAGASLLLGGVLSSRAGDILTRLGGLGVSIIMVGAILLVHLNQGWTGMEFQVLLLASGLFFLLRGNSA